MKPPTAQELERWEKLDREATPGPWEWDVVCGGGDPHEDPDVPFVRFPDGRWFTVYTELGVCSDVRFIAASREALPRAVARIRELEAEKAEREKPCRWVWDDELEWQDGCSECFHRHLTEYCQNCGRTVEVVDE